MSRPLFFINVYILLLMGVYMYILYYYNGIEYHVRRHARGAI